MSLVERLAKGFAEWSTAQSDIWDDEQCTRFFLNAIADELDQKGEDHRTTGRPGEPHMHSWSSRWLRAQANPDSAESKGSYAKLVTTFPHERKDPRDG